jgi:gamma-butyrobetaine dioxygenase
LPVDTSPEFLPTLRRFADLLARPTSAWRYLLKEGDAVLFDNRRVLHARDAFEEAGERWLKGCYLGADEVWERARVERGAATEL